jgi:hypothetical protein
VVRTRCPWLVPTRKNRMLWCLGIWVATLLEVGQCFGQNAQFSAVADVHWGTSRWKCNGAPPCCKMKSSESSCSCGDSHSVGVSRYGPCHCVLRKNNGPKTRVRGMAQKTLTLGESLSCSMTTCGVSVPHMRTLWRFTFPLKLNVLSSLNVRRFTKSSSFVMWLNFAAEVESCYHITLLQGQQQVQAVRAHLNPLPDNAPDRGWPSSRLVHLVDFLELRWKVTRTRFMAFSDTRGLPVLFPLQMHLSCSILLYQRYMFVRHSGGFFCCARNDLCTAVAEPSLANCNTHNAFSWVAMTNTSSPWWRKCVQLKRHLFHAALRKSWLPCQPSTVICYKGSGMNWTTGLTCAVWHEGRILSICNIKNKLGAFLYILLYTTCSYQT